MPGTMPPGQSDCPPSADRRTGGRAGFLTNDSACTTMCPLRLRLNAGLFRHQSFNLAKARRGSRRRRRSIVVPTHTLYTIILLSWCVVGKDILLSIFNTQCRGKKRELKCWHKRTLPLLFGKIRMEEKIQLMMVARRRGRRRWMCELYCSIYQAGGN